MTFLRIGLIFLQSVPNHSQHRIEVVHHVIVPKPQDYVSFRFQKFSPLFVILFLIQMLTSVQLDNKPPPRGAKIHNVIADGVLVSKMHTAHAMRPQMLPKFFLGFGHVTVKFFGAPEDFGGGAALGPPPCPPPLPKSDNRGGKTSSRNGITVFINNFCSPSPKSAR